MAWRDPIQKNADQAHAPAVKLRPYTAEQFYWLCEKFGYHHHGPEARRHSGRRKPPQGGQTKGTYKGFTGIHVYCKYEDDLILAMTVFSILIDDEEHAVRRTLRKDGSTYKWLKMPNPRALTKLRLML